MPKGMEIRPAGGHDAEGVARLSEQLGYPVAVEEARRRLADVAARADHACLVAVDGEQILGWIHVFESLHVESARSAEIGGLIVESRRRDHGIGTALLDAAEAWARQRGIERLRVRTNIVRTDAHRFYVRQGFAVLKQQDVLTKALSPDA